MATYKRNTPFGPQIFFASNSKDADEQKRKFVARMRAEDNPSDKIFFKKLKSTKKPAAKKKGGRVGAAGSGLKKYNTAIMEAPAVKRETSKIKKLEAQIKVAKKAKAAAKKVAAKNYAAKKR